MRLAIAGFRHGHVGAIYNMARKLDYVDIVACVEEDPVGRDTIVKELGVELTHDTLDEVFDSVEFDALACVDYYAKRGPTVIRALQAGKHCITDKPLCTRVDELRQIAKLAREGGLTVHVDLTMRYSATAVALRNLVRDGAIGDLVSCAVFGQHGLSWGSRPNWYFEEGKHGGTLNDIMIHGIDMVRWITGAEYEKVIAAGASGVQDSPAPASFQQSAQCFLQLDNGARLFGDASYLCPEGHGSPWRFYLWGSRGHIYYESGQAPVVQPAGEPEYTAEPADFQPLDPFEDFARQVQFGEDGYLTMDECLKSTMAALTAQAAADTDAQNLTVERV